MDSARRRHLDLLNKMGYIEALVFWGFGDFVEKHRIGNIKVALRSGHPIMASARWRQDNLGEGRFADWKGVYMNEATTKLVSGDDADPDPEKEELLNQYYKQEGLDEPFTLADTGYFGTQSKRMLHAGYNLKKTCLITAGNDVWRKRCKFEHNPNSYGFLNEVVENEKVHIPRAVKKYAFNIWGWQMFDKDIPHVESPTVLENFRSNGERVSVMTELQSVPVQDEVAAFYDGFYTGHTDIAAAHDGGKVIDYGAYMRLLTDNYDLIPDRLAMENDMFVCGRNKRIKDDDPKDALPEWHARVEEIYSGK